MNSNTILERLSRGQDIKVRGGIKPRFLGRGRYLARGSNDEQYTVMITAVTSSLNPFRRNELSCDCRDHRYTHGVCKHMWAAMIDAGERDHLNWDELESVLNTLHPND